MLDDLPHSGCRPIKYPPAAAAFALVRGVSSALPSLPSCSVSSSHILRLLKTNDLPYFWSKGIKYPHTPSSASFSTSSNADGTLGNCENAWVSWGGEENP